VYQHVDRVVTGQRLLSAGFQSCQTSRLLTVKGRELAPDGRHALPQIGWLQDLDRPTEGDQRADGGLAAREVEDGQALAGPVDDQVAHDPRELAGHRRLDAGRHADALGDRLVREGRITQTQYDESLVRMKITGKRHGITLVEMQMLTADELFLLVHAQIQAIIDSVFAWTTGTIAFTPGRDKALEFVKVDISVPDAIASA